MPIVPPIPPPVEGNPLNATSFAPGTPGVAGTNMANAGIGVFGQSSAVNGVGVKGSSAVFDAVVGETNSTVNADVTGRNLTTGAGGGCGIYGVGGQYAGKFDGNVQVNGTLFATTDIVLGSDCAEDFDITPNAVVEPGTVMVLSDNGALRASHDPYDKRVAGVISGAGDYQPGMILGRSGSPLDRMPLGLVGKVYCKVDTKNAPIEIGDLLTTSDTPGHAMKAEDHTRAFGAVIGKALRNVSAGEKDLIPILIALQ